MKDTPLSGLHTNMGAKMAEFAGYNMPIVYSSIKEEHLAVRESVGMFDVSHMGEFMVEGPNALELIQKVTSNDASTLIEGQAQYSCLPNDTGGIVDDLLVYKMTPEQYMLVVNASNIEKDWDWINSQNSMGAELSNVSDETALIAVQGPNAAKALQSLTDVDLDAIKFYHFEIGNFAGIHPIVISATGYTGSGGFEIYVPWANAEEVWNKIMEAGSEYNIQPAGLAARDTLRLEMGYCLYGNDIDDSTNPIEAGLGWITKFTKDFVGDEFAKKIKEEGGTRRLAAFEMLERGIPRKDYEVENMEGEKIGIVTSGTQSPSLDKAIGLAYLNKPFNKSETEINICIRNKKAKAKVVKLPFYKG